MRWLAIFVAGGIGAAIRVGIVEWFATRHPGSFPWGVLAVNAVGCFAIGLLYSVCEGRVELSPDARVALQGGFLGGLTTFSAFGLDTWRLVETGHSGLAAANVTGNVAVGMFAVALGVIGGRAFR